MSKLYKTNNLYRVISLLCKLRNVTISKMCSIAEISPGIITDLKMGRKQSIQTETAVKIANALRVPLDFILNFPYEYNKYSWNEDVFEMWDDADSDSDRLYIIKTYGVCDQTYLLEDMARVIFDTLPSYSTNPVHVTPTAKGYTIKNSKEYDLSLMKTYVSDNVKLLYSNLSIATFDDLCEIHEMLEKCVNIINERKKRLEAELSTPTTQTETPPEE